tara:strand:+ start:876 stop:3314 length:2439 start_codon:yes stop_codon:yes gene_type:complete
MQKDKLQMVDDDQVENVGIMSGFMDEIDELMSEISDDDREEGEDADMARTMSRTPDSPEILMNNLRGDMRSIDARREELADLVGFREAEETPEGVLALLQPVLAQQQAAPPMPMPAGPAPMPQGMPPEMAGMAPPPMPAGPAPAMGGIGGLPMDQAMMPGMYQGGPVQNFNQGSGQMGVTPANDAFSAYPSDIVEEAQRRVRAMMDGGMVQQYNKGGVVQHFENGSTEEAVSAAGSYAPALRQPAVDYLTALMGREGAAVPDLQTAMADEAALYETLGLGTDKSANQAQMLFDIGQAAFGYAGNVGADGRPMQGSAAARLSQSLAPLAGKIGARGEAMSKEAQALKLAALKGAQGKISAAQASNAALAESQTGAAIKLAQQPKLSAMQAQIEFLKNSGASDAEIIETLFPGKSLTGSAADIAALKGMGKSDDEITALLWGSSTSPFAEQKAFLESLNLPGGNEALASRLGLGLPKDQQPTEFQVKVKMMEDANFTPEQILDRIAPPDKPSPFREKFDMLTATGDYSPKDALNLLVGDNSTARDQRIQDIMKATGRERDQVVLDLENQLRTDPTSGVTSLYEPFTRKFTPVIVDWANTEGADASRVTVPPLSAENIQPLLREGEGVGIKSALANTFNSVIGQFIPIMEFDSEREARERIGAINVAVNEAFTGGGRSPVITLEKLQQLFPEPNEAWLNPKDAALKFQTSASYLAQVYADDLRGSKDPQLGQKEMQDLGARAKGMLNALQLIVTPETLKQIESVAESGLRVEDNYKKLGIEQILAIDPSNMVPLERAAYTARLKELKSLAPTEEK